MPFLPIWWTGAGQTLRPDGQHVSQAGAEPLPLPDSVTASSAVDVNCGGAIGIRLEETPGPTINRRGQGTTK